MTRQQALPVGIVLVVVIALLAWALQLMQSAIDQQEFFVDARGLFGVFSRRWFGHGDGDDF